MLVPERGVRGVGLGVQTQCAQAAREVDLTGPVGPRASLQHGRSDLRVHEFTGMAPRARAGAPTCARSVLVCTTPCTTLYSEVISESSTRA